MKNNIRFTNPHKTDFQKTVIKRVENYFTQNGISPYADYRMVIKTIVMFALYFVPYLLILFGKLSLPIMWLCTIVMGVGLAGIGMSIMHDANHGAYSAKSWVNKLLGYSLNLIGGDAFNWKIQHNQLHHTFTNIHGYDQDIRNRMNLRFTPQVKKNKLHRFQFFYAFIFYALQTFFWVLLKDFLQFFQFNNTRYQQLNFREKFFRIGFIFFTKAFYFIYIILMPYYILHLKWWYIFIGFMTVHAVGGFLLTVVFQLAHVVVGTSFPEPDKQGNVDEEWAIHQMRTTADFAPENELLTFFVGGLNFQIEHHLFQRICHIHYPAIAPIVRQTALEFGIPYLCNTTFSSAFASHVALLQTLGTKETLELATDF